MTSSGQRPSIGSNQASSTAAAPARSDDPAWAHALVVEGKRHQTICIYCNRTLKGGGITRLKEHLGGIIGDCQPCKKVPVDVKWQMEKYVMDSRKEKAKKKQRNEEIGNPYGTPLENEEEDMDGDDDIEVVSNPMVNQTARKGKEKMTSASFGQKKRKGLFNTPATKFFMPRTTGGSQPSIKSALATKQMIDATDMAVSRWWFDANIPFNAARSKFYQPMADAINAIGQGIS